MKKALAAAALAAAALTACTSGHPAPHGSATDDPTLAALATQCSQLVGKPVSPHQSCTAGSMVYDQPYTATCDDGATLFYISYDDRVVYGLRGHDWRSARYSAFHISTSC